MNGRWRYIEWVGVIREREREGDKERGIERDREGE
jgi:hypothetical protein